MAQGFDVRARRGADGVIELIAPAKLTLYLHITGRRSDGYHLLESAFVFSRSGDMLRCTPATGLKLDITGPFAGALNAAGGAGEGNLVLKAARLVADALGVEPKAHITLEKNLPVASGIGGGSSDAATALIGLRAFWSGVASTKALSRLDDRRLLKMAESLGADVPACLLAKPQFVAGIGEKLKPLKTGETLGLVMINPGMALSTPEVFAAYARLRSFFSMQRSAAIVEPMSLATEARNDLLQASAGLCPMLREGLEALLATEGPMLVRMAGSGATLFALYENNVMAERAAKALQEACPGWWVQRDEVVMPHE